MRKVNDVLARLKNPIVITSIISQILIILSVFKLNIDVDLITKAVFAAGSILISLGIVNNPAEEKVVVKELTCEHCGKEANHVLIAGNFVCQECGCTSGEQCSISEKKKIIK